MDDVEVDQPFVGRRDFLDKLGNDWDRHRLLQVHGLRAVGKTRTIQQFLKEKREQDEEDSDSSFVKISKELKIIGVNMRIINSVSMLHSNICAQLGIAPIKVDTDSHDWIYQIACVVNEDDQIQPIFVFDNAEDILDTGMKDNFLSLCRTVIKNCKNVKIIITTTTNAQFVELKRTFCSLELPPLSMADSHKLLMQVTPDVDLGIHSMEIVKLCAGLPLALLMVGAMLTENDCLLAPEEMVDLLVKCRVEALSEDCYPEDERIGPVYQKFIQRLSEVFQSRLAILGYIPGSFDAQAAMTMLDDKTPAKVKQNSLIPLVQRNMLQVLVVPEIKTQRFDIHGILRECLSVYFTIKNIKDVRARFIHAFSVVMVRISQQMSTLQYARAMMDFSQEHPNLQKLMTEVYDCPEDSYHYFIHVTLSCTNLIEKFMAEKGQHFYTKCLELAKSVKREHDMATVYIALGSMLTNTEGKFLAAEENFCHAKVILEGEQKETEQLARLYYSMAYNLYIQGRGVDALRYVQMSVDMLSRLGLRETEFYLTSLAYLGVVLTFLGQLKEGEKCHFTVLGIRKTKQGENHPSVGAAYNNLGVLYEQQKDYEKAKEFYQKGLDVKVQSKAAYWSIVFSLNNVALQHANGGDFAKAKEMLSEARQMLEGRSEANYAPVSLICNSFGKVYLKEKKFDMAVRELEEATRIREGIMSKGPFIVSTLLLLSRAYIGAGRYKDALRRLTQAMEKKVDLRERMPHNDLVHQCQVCLLQVYSATEESDKVEVTLDEAEDELHRLMYVLRDDVKRADEFAEKLQIIKTRKLEHILSKLKLW